jgi:hypothetical protein
MPHEELGEKQFANEQIFDVRIREASGQRP